MYEMFMGPFEAAKPWSKTGVEASYKFLGRIWRLFMTEEGTLNAAIGDVEGTESFQRVWHQSIKKVTEDVEALRFNTMISQLMIFINEAYRQEQLPKKAMEDFVKLLSPLAPHIAEELWAALGHSGTISYEPWPKYDEAKLVESEIEIVVQINGKVKAKLVIPADTTKEAMEEIATKDEKVIEALEGKTIQKIIAVTGKLINIVAN